MKKNNSSMTLSLRRLGLPSLGDELTSETCFNLSDHGEVHLERLDGLDHCISEEAGGYRFSSFEPSRLS